MGKLSFVVGIFYGFPYCRKSQSIEQKAYGVWNQRGFPTKNYGKIPSSTVDGKPEKMS